MLLVVLAGGIVGTSARYGLKIALPADDWPWGTWTVNVLGAFLLGLIVAALASRGPDTGRRRTLRLLLGTGVMGSFTTYSSLAVETERLLAGGRIGLGIAYAGATLLLGLAASLAGLVLGARGRGRGIGRAARRRVEEVEA
jgi:CrcB protein